MAKSIEELTELNGGIGPNAMRIRGQGELIVRGRIPAQVRKELMAAVKLKQLGRLKKDGLKPEVFFHPDHLHTAKERQRIEAEYSAGLIAKAFA